MLAQDRILAYSVHLTVSWYLSGG